MVGGVYAWSVWADADLREPFWAIPGRLLRVCFTPPVVIAGMFASEREAPPGGRGAVSEDTL